MGTSQVFSFFILLMFLNQKATSNGPINMRGKDQVRGILGAIVDYSSRAGKEEKVAMEMAIKDFYDKTNQSFDLHIENSQGEPFQAALAAKELVDKHKVQAILGPQAWEEASLVAEIASQAHVPVLSLSDASPDWAVERWPFTVQASPNQHLQMRAIAAIVRSWDWHQVTVIYGDTDSSMSGVIPHLSDALREVGAEVHHIQVLSPFTSSLTEELEKLKQDQCRVFVVHLSLQLAMHLFERAKKMEMMEKGYVWITASALTSFFHSFNTSTLSSMQGVLGVRSYFPENEPHVKNFSKRFCVKFGLEYPEEDKHEPGIYALQAYDAVWTICSAIKESSRGGQHLLQKILLSDFQGLGGKIKFVENKLAPAPRFQIINVVGKSYMELGFWSDRLDFSKIIGEKATYNASMKSLGHVIWPGHPWSTPRGWAIPTNANPLKIGIPMMSSFKQYVNVVYDPLNNNYSFEGFAIDLFIATVKSMPYFLPYNFTHFDGTYDDLVEQIHLKKFDAVIGDVAIVATRYQYAEFTHPYTESGLVMIVPVQSQTSRAWLFMKPFTKAMWVLAMAITLYNGFVVWLIERNYSPELKGSVLNQIGSLIWLAFTTLFSLQGEKLHSNLSRMAMVAWLFVALVITQTYTANLTSILTVQRLVPAVADVQSLQSSNARVGYCRGAFVSRYLRNVLNFRAENIRNYSSPDEFAQALRSREIAAAFLEFPFAKLFLAKYCKEFITAGPTYKVGGFGFAFPRGSLLLHDVTKVLLNVSESGKLRELENNMLASEKCVDVESDEEISSLSPSSFWVLFVLTAGTSTVCLLVYMIRHKLKLGDSGHISIWRLMLAVIKQWGQQRRQLSRRVSDVERPTSSPGV